MFGGSPSDRQRGSHTLEGVVECAARCISAGRFRPGRAEVIAHQMWIATHGLVTLQLGHHLMDPDQCFEAQMIGLMVGAGDSLESARLSVLSSQERLDTLSGARGAAGRP
jgi:hypothetical protein